MTKPEVKLIVEATGQPFLIINLRGDGVPVSLPEATDLANTICILAESGQQIVQDREAASQRGTNASD